MSAKQYGIPTPIQFDRLYAGPLEKYDTFESYADALVYAQGPISYPGQRIGVKKSGLKEDVYVINQDKSLSRLMIQREDIHVVLYKDKWTGEVPYEQNVIVPYLEPTDNCIISLGDAVNDPEVVREIVNAKIGDTIQEEGSIRFIARGDKPKVDIPITITIGSVVSAVEIPNNVNDNTNHTVVIAKQDAWEGAKPPYTQKLKVFGVRPDSNGTIGINPDSSHAQMDKIIAATAGVVRYEQGNNYVTIAAMNSKPTADLEILVVWGDEIVVFENSDTIEDFNVNKELILEAEGWSSNRPYTQRLRVEGLSEYHTGAIGLSDNCTVEQAEIGLNAGIELIEQGEGYVIVRANDIKPTIDLPVYLTYGSNITVVPAPEYVGEANRHVDTTAYASKWTKTVNGWEQEIDVEGITSNSIGTMGLRNGATELQGYNAAVARIKITKVYDNKVLLTATGVRPAVNLPLCFVFGRNINVAKYPGVVGKVALSATYIAVDDSNINSGVSNVQNLLEYLYREKISKDDIVDKVHDGDIHTDYIPEVEWSNTEVLSSRMGRYLFKRKINYDDIIDNVTSDEKLKPLSANQGKILNNNISNLITDNTNAHNVFNSRITTIEENLSNTIIKIQEEEPEYIDNRYNVIWIKTKGETSTKPYTVTFDANGGINAPSSQSTIIGESIIIPVSVPTRDGYVFSHWSRAGASETILPGTTFKSNESIILYANWSPRLYRVTLDSQSASTTPSINNIYYYYANPVFYNDDPTKTNAQVITKLDRLPAKTAAEYNGYYSEINGNGALYITEDGTIVQSLCNIALDSTIYADWAMSKYTVTYDANGGTWASGSITEQSEEFGTNLIIMEDYPTKNGLIFIGWSTDKYDTIATWSPGDLYIENQDATLYAIYATMAIFNAKLTTEGSDDEDAIVYYKYNTNEYFDDSSCTTRIDYISIPEMHGYIFDGYYYNDIQYIDNSGVISDSLCTINRNMTLVSKWTPINYTIDFEAEDAAPIPDSIIVPYGKTIIIDNIIPVLDKNEFAGWIDESEFSDEEDREDAIVYYPGSEYLVTKNTTLTATWNPICKAILYDGENIVDEIHYVYSIDKYYDNIERTSQISNIIIPEKEGYSFNGYYTEPDENGDRIECITNTGAIINLHELMPTYDNKGVLLDIKLVAEWI